MRYSSVDEVMKVVLIVSAVCAFFDPMKLCYRKNLDLDEQFGIYDFDIEIVKKIRLQSISIFVYIQHKLHFILQNRFMCSD